MNQEKIQQLQSLMEKARPLLGGAEIVSVSPKNAKVLWAMGALKKFLSSYVELSQIVDKGDIEISYPETSSAVINCICVDRDAIKEDLVTLLKKAGWSCCLLPDY
jgi:hypothetical protein